MKLIKTKTKGAGLVREGEWIFVEGQIPTREMEFIVWCHPDDPGFDDFIKHCETLI